MMGAGVGLFVLDALVINQGGPALLVLVIGVLVLAVCIPLALANQTLHTLSYTYLPPCGRNVYRFVSKEWTSIDGI